MSEKLEKLLKEFDEKSNSKKEFDEKFIAELQVKKETFNSAFKELMSKTIRPTMSLLLKKLQEHKINAQIHEDKTSRHLSYIHENYIIKYGRNQNSMIISIVGNSDHQKVFIYSEYKEGSLPKKNENSYELTEITSAFLDELVTESVSKILIYLRQISF